VNAEEDKNSEQPQTTPVSRPAKLWRRSVLWAVVLLGVVTIGVAGFVTRGAWLPPAAAWLAEKAGVASARASPSVEADAHAGHDHPGEAGPGDAGTSLALSQQGRKNIGLTLATIELRDFQRTITVPAVLVERPGQSEVTVSAPMTGIVTRIHPIRGEAVAPGMPLFDLRLTHEDLVDKQSDLLRDVQQLDVVKREVARLDQVTASGAVAGKTLLERQYEQQKIEAAIEAGKQALLLHGLSEEQIQRIVRERRLLQHVTVAAPPFADPTTGHAHDDFYQVSQLAVKPGDHVATGTVLAMLSDHCELYVEGKAFAQDAEALNQAANAGAGVAALITANGLGTREVAGLKILYVENEVERDSRALKFYVALPNELVRNEQTPDGHRFIGWRYKPGQRVELLIPVERWAGRIVLPVEAVVQDGAETYVYQQDKGQFARQPVHVEHRDQRWVVIEADGTLFPGDTVAVQGAYQIHLALKNKAGGGPDPHAGHNH
jgi:multidrug efflux pump subunit AcrA (membrane-fusion protein)